MSESFRHFLGTGPFRRLAKLFPVKDLRGGYLQTGFQELDDSDVLNKGSLTVLSGKICAGKSTFAANIAGGVWNEGWNVLYVSLEMSESESLLRVMSALSGVPLRNLLRKALTDEDREGIARFGRRVSDNPADFVVTTVPPATVGGDLGPHLRACAAGVPGLSLIVIDSLQMLSGGLSPDGKSAVVRQLKQLARELDVAVLLVSHLSRAAGERATLADLDRYCEDLSAHADVVLLMHSAGSVGRQTQTVEVSVEKNRNGPTDAVLRVRYFADCVRFGRLGS